MDINSSLWQSIGSDEKTLDAIYEVFPKTKNNPEEQYLIHIPINTNNFGGKFKKFTSNIDLKTPLVKGNYSNQSNNILEHTFHFYDGYDDSYVAYSAL